MKSKMMLSACLFLAGCATSRPYSQIAKVDGNTVRVTDLKSLEVGTLVHLHKNICHTTKNQTKTKSYIKCDKERVAEGQVLEISPEKGSLIKLDRDITLTDDMFFEENGQEVKN